MTNRERIQKMKMLLQDLQPVSLQIDDDSHLHRGHPGAKSGKGYFTINIASPLFSGKSKIQCHQMIYAKLKDLMATEIHALSIKILDHE